MVLRQVKNMSAALPLVNAGWPSLACASFPLQLHAVAVHVQLFCSGLPLPLPRSCTRTPCVIGTGPCSWPSQRRPSRRNCGLFRSGLSWACCWACCWACWAWRGTGIQLPASPGAGASSLLAWSWSLATRKRFLASDGPGPMSTTLLTRASKKPRSFGPHDGREKFADSNCFVQEGKLDGIRKTWSKMSVDFDNGREVPQGAAGVEGTAGGGCRTARFSQISPRHVHNALRLSPS